VERNRPVGPALLRLVLKAYSWIHTFAITAEADYKRKPGRVEVTI